MSKRILVVEDQEDNRQIIRDMTNGYSTAHRGRLRGHTPNQG
jgi:CheY-like chemotaxis protein